MHTVFFKRALFISWYITEHYINNTKPFNYMSIAQVCINTPSINYISSLFFEHLYMYMMPLYITPIFITEEFCLVTYVQLF